MGCVLDLRGMKFGKEMDQFKIPESSVVIIKAKGATKPGRRKRQPRGAYIVTERKNQAHHPPLAYARIPGSLSVITHDKTLRKTQTEAQRAPALSNCVPTPPPAR